MDWPLALTVIFWALSAGVVFTTLSPLLRTRKWWVRAWEFPRVQIAVAAFLTVALGLGIAAPLVWAGIAAALGCGIYQLRCVAPYSPLWRREVTVHRNVAADRQVTMICVNVLMENQDHDRLRALIEREDPDILFLMETDDTWCAAVDPLLDRYDTVIRHPSDDYYGLVFATRLSPAQARIVYLSDDDTPAVLADLGAPSGRFVFVGLHPRPPVPGEDTHARDEQIRTAAHVADDTRLPVVAMGDFNDVAWSRSSRRFKQIGGFRDPRIGRGILPSFDVRSWLLRFPIDQLYLTEGVSLISFTRLEDIGSDHFPMRAVIAIEQDDAAVS